LKIPSKRKYPGSPWIFLPTGLVHETPLQPTKETLHLLDIVDPSRVSLRMTSFVRCQSPWRLNIHVSVTHEGMDTNGCSPLQAKIGIAKNKSQVLQAAIAMLAAAVASEQMRCFLRGGGRNSWK